MAAHRVRPGLALLYVGPQAGAVEGGGRVAAGRRPADARLAVDRAPGPLGADLDLERDVVRPRSGVARDCRGCGWNCCSASCPPSRPPARKYRRPKTEGTALSPQQYGGAGRAHRSPPHQVRCHGKECPSGYPARSVRADICGGGHESSRGWESSVVVHEVCEGVRVLDVRGQHRDAPWCVHHPSSLPPPMASSRNVEGGWRKPMVQRHRSGGAFAPHERPAGPVSMNWLVSEPI